MITPRAFLAMVADLAAGLPLACVRDMTGPAPVYLSPTEMMASSPPAYVAVINVLRPGETGAPWVSVVATGRFGLSAGEYAYLCPPEGVDRGSVDEVRVWLTEVLPPVVSVAAERAQAERGAA